MSMETWTDEGYGIVNDAALNQKYVDLIRKLSQEVPADCEMVFISRYDRQAYLKELDRCIIAEDSIDEAIDTFYGFIPLDFLARYLNFKLDCVGFYAPSRDDDDVFGLLYAPLYPWEGKEGDRKITQEIIDKKLTTIAEALGWDIKPDKQVLHYCG